MVARSLTFCLFQEDGAPRAVRPLKLLRPCKTLKRLIKAIQGLNKAFEDLKWALEGLNKPFEANEAFGATINP